MSLVVDSSGQMAMVASCATGSPTSRFARPSGRLAKARSNIYLGKYLLEKFSLILYCDTYFCFLVVIKSCGLIVSSSIIHFVISLFLRHSDGTALRILPGRFACILSIVSSPFPN